MIGPIFVVQLILAGHVQSEYIEPKLSWRKQPRASHMEGTSYKRETLPDKDTIAPTDEIYLPNPIRCDNFTHIGTLSTLSKQFEVSLSLEVSGWKAYGHKIFGSVLRGQISDDIDGCLWHDITRMTPYAPGYRYWSIKTQRVCAPGLILPAIHIDELYKVQARFPVNTPDEGIWPTKKFTWYGTLVGGSWMDIKIRQELQFGNRYMYTVMINGLIVERRENLTPRSFRNVRYFAGDKYGWATGTFVKNIKIRNLNKGDASFNGMLEIPSGVNCSKATNGGDAVVETKLKMDLIKVVQFLAANQITATFNAKKLSCTSSDGSTTEKAFLQVESLASGTKIVKEDLAQQVLDAVKNTIHYKSKFGSIKHNEEKNQKCAPKEWLAYRAVGANATVGPDVCMNGAQCTLAPQQTHHMFWTCSTLSGGLDKTSKSPLFHQISTCNKGYEHDGVTCEDDCGGSRIQLINGPGSTPMFDATWDFSNADKTLKRGNEWRMAFRWRPKAGGPGPVIGAFPNGPFVTLLHMNQKQSAIDSYINSNNRTPWSNNPFSRFQRLAFKGDSLKSVVSWGMGGSTNNYVSFGTQDNDHSNFVVLDMWYAFEITVTKKDDKLVLSVKINGRELGQPGHSTFASQFILQPADHESYLYFGGGTQLDLGQRTGTKAQLIKFQDGYKPPLGEICSVTYENYEAGKDECADGTHLCDKHATCTKNPNSKFGYTCECNHGYEDNWGLVKAWDRTAWSIFYDETKFSNITGGFDCQPITVYGDICETGQHNCDEYADCIYAEGDSFTCQCFEGYTGNGRTCKQQSNTNTIGFNGPKMPKSDGFIGTIAKLGKEWELEFEFLIRSDKFQWIKDKESAKNTPRYPTVFRAELADGADVCTTYPSDCQMDQGLSVMVGTDSVNTYKENWLYYQMPYNGRQWNDYEENHIMRKEKKALEVGYWYKVSMSTRLLYGQHYYYNITIDGIQQVGKQLSVQPVIREAVKLYIGSNRGLPAKDTLVRNFRFQSILEPPKPCPKIKNHVECPGEKCDFSLLKNPFHEDEKDTKSFMGVCAGPTAGIGSVPCNDAYRTDGVSCLADAECDGSFLLNKNETFAKVDRLGKEWYLSFKFRVKSTTQLKIDSFLKLGSVLSLGLETTTSANLRRGYTSEKEDIMLSYTMTWAGMRKSDFSVEVQPGKSTGHQLVYPNKWIAVEVYSVKFWRFWNSGSGFVNNMEYDGPNQWASFVKINGINPTYHPDFLKPTPAPANDPLGETWLSFPQLRLYNNYIQSISSSLVGFSLALSSLG